MKIKLKWKLTLIFCSLIVIVLGVIFTYLNTHLKDYLEQRIENNLKSELYLSRDIIEDELSRGRTLIDMDKLARKISQSLGLRVTIIRTDGKIESDSGMNLDGLLIAENHLERPEVQQASSEGFGQSKRFSTTKKIQMLYMAVPLKNTGTVGFIRLAMPLSDLNSVISRMKNIVFPAFAIAFILTVIFGYLISFMVSKPVLEMSSIAKDLARGDFSKRISLQQKDEIGDLAHALNHMSAELKNKMGKIMYEEAKLDAVISSMSEGVLLTDDDGNILMMNPTLRKLFLVDSIPEGKKPIEIMRNNRIQDLVEAIITGRKRIAAEEVFVNLSEEKIMRINGGPIIKNGSMTGAILVFHDITELRKLEKVRQDFVANVSHELKTPLASIKGYAETLLEGALDDKSNSRDFTGIIYRESGRLAKLIEDLLDLSRIESGKMSMALLPVDIGKIITKVADILNRPVQDKRINLSISVNPGTPLILADEGRVIQVILNILDNAIKFTPEDGSIKISAYKKDGFVQVDINDTGAGIPENDIPRIFERFYRVDKARSRDLGGTGLGLSIVKHIVQAHRGDVWVTSTLGKGSTFSFTLPSA